MEREELRKRVYTLSPLETDRKKQAELTGELAEGSFRFWEKGENGYEIFSNDGMVSLSDGGKDKLHLPIVHNILGRSLRLIIHARYSHIPFHSTEFVSVHYVYSGHLIIDFPTRRVILQKGQAMLMNRDIVHALSFETQKDIIMSMQIEQDFLNDKLLYSLRGTGPVADFLLSCMTGKASDFSYLITGFENDARIQNLFEDMFCEYLEPGVISDVLIENYIRIYFAYLIRSSSTIINTNSRADLSNILTFIEEHASDCTLSMLAEKFHFSPKYLSNMLRQKTGASFRELLEKARMRRVCFYLKTTDLPVRDIAGQAGYTNMTFFFRRFKELYQISPAQYREGGAR